MNRIQELHEMLELDQDTLRVHAYYSNTSELRDADYHFIGEYQILWNDLSIVETSSTGRLEDMVIEILDKEYNIYRFDNTKSAYDFIINNYN